MEKRKIINKKIMNLIESPKNSSPIKKYCKVNTGIWTKIAVFLQWFVVANAKSGGKTELNWWEIEVNQVLLS